MLPVICRDPVHDNVLELDDLLGVLWHWCCSVPSQHLLVIAKNSLRCGPSNSSTEITLTSWSSATQSGIVRTRVRPAETSELSVTSLFQHGTTPSCPLPNHRQSVIASQLLIRHLLRELQLVYLNLLDLLDYHLDVLHNHLPGGPFHRDFDRFL